MLNTFLEIFNSLESVWITLGNLISCKIIYPKNFWLKSDFIGGVGIGTLLSKDESFYRNELEMLLKG